MKEEVNLPSVVYYDIDGNQSFKKVDKYTLKSILEFAKSNNVIPDIKNMRDIIVFVLTNEDKIISLLWCDISNPYFLTPTYNVGNIDNCVKLITMVLKHTVFINTQRMPRLKEVLTLLDSNKFIYNSDESSLSKVVFFKGEGND